MKKFIVFTLILVTFIIGVFVYLHYNDYSCKDITDNSSQSSVTDKNNQNENRYELILSDRYIFF